MRSIRWFMLVCFVFMLTAAAPAAAKDQITYASQPDEIYIFLNNVAYIRDQITIPADVNARVFLPAGVYVDTLLLREDDRRVTNYVIRRAADGQVVLEWQGAGSGVRSVTLEYLLSGLSWTPRYDMTLGDETAASVQFNFFAAIQNSAMALEEVTVNLIAGRVDVSGQVTQETAISANQIIAGYDQGGTAVGTVGAATIQYIYPVGELTAVSGDTLYLSLLGAELPARRLLVWNAESDQQVSVIYKVRNESPLPFTQGLVYAYQDGIFIGTDAIEVTPVGSEGSITVGRLQNVRVGRSESQTADETAARYTLLHRVELTLTNFGDEAVEIEVVDRQNVYGEDFVFQQEPTRETGNLLRWIVTVAPNETVRLNYEFKTR